MDKTQFLAITERILAEKLQLLELSINDIAHDVSLLEQGVLDSVSFIEYLTEIETEFDIEISFEENDISDLTTINALHLVALSALQA